jgi:regulator of protease activity HflC (stomatin/prohibitin superfamily)
MEQNAKRIGLLNWVALLIATLALLGLTNYVNSAACAMATALAGFGLLASLLSYFQMGMVERENFERLEIEELSKSRGGQSLFTSAGDDTFPAKRSREQFEKIVVPCFTGLLLILQIGAAYFPWMKLTSILFVLGKYSSGLARLQGQRLLRPGAAYLMLTAYACWAVTVTFALMLADFPKADVMVGRALCVLTGLIALETLLALLLEIYRVRVRGGEARLLYDSRLVGLLGQPEAVFTTAAHALDYQFGFKVSETWFYRMLEKALGWMILAQFAALILSTCFVVIEPGDEALIERFGRPAGADGVIGPGLHVKFPWPIDKVYPEHTERIQMFTVGAEPENVPVVQWTVSHGKEENFLVANTITNRSVLAGESRDATNAPPVSLLSISIPVQFQITNLVSWAYVNEDPTTLLRGLAEREVMLYLAHADFDNLMSRGREQAADALRVSIQADVDRANLGARIVYVGLQDIHPPVKVAKVFEEVVGAGQTREAKILDALAHAVSTNAWARGESNRVVDVAEAGRHRSVTNAGFMNSARIWKRWSTTQRSRASISCRRLIRRKF